MSIHGTCKVCGGETVDYSCSSCDFRRIEHLEAEVERLRELVTDTRDAMALMIGTDVRVPWQMVADEDVDSWIERIQQIKGGGE